MSLPAEKPAVPRPEPPLAPRRPGSLNLARRPFTNARPVTRVSILLWTLGLLLLLGNVSLFWSYLSGSAEKRDDLERLKEDVRRQQETVRQLDQRLASLDLEQQNRKVRFLNRKIEERTFSWSLLLDRLAETMPDGIRLTRLAPRSMEEKQGAARRQDLLEPSDGRVLLTLNGVAKSDTDLLTFVDRLFAHDSFDDPNFTRETRTDENDPSEEFDIQVIYIPGGKTGQPVIEEEAGPQPEILEAPLPSTAPPAGAPGPEGGR